MSLRYSVLSVGGLRRELGARSLAGLGAEMGRVELDHDEPDSGRDDSISSVLETGRATLSEELDGARGGFDDAGLGTELRSEICGSGLCRMLAGNAGGNGGGPAGLESSSGNAGRSRSPSMESGAMDSAAYGEGNDDCSGKAVVPSMGSSSSSYEGNEFSELGDEEIGAS